MYAMNPAVRAFKQDATDNPDEFWSRAAEHLPWFRTSATGVSAPAAAPVG